MVAWSAAAGGQSRPSSRPPDARALVARGRVLFAQGCASCHGEDLRGRPELGPSLRGAGAAAADFYLSTGRMPLADPTDEPVRTRPFYPRAGMAKYTEHCAGCHQIVGRGGIVTGAAVPVLDQATLTQLGEAVRIGPYLMPRFSAKQLDQPTLDSIARYVQSIRHPDNRGGWGIGNLGPVPEGMVTWFLAMIVLLAIARVIGEPAP
jgi:ubiquinol-cytochrome c reductase cytochrome c subunit